MDEVNDYVTGNEVRIFVKIEDATPVAGRQIERHLEA